MSLEFLDVLCLSPQAEVIMQRNRAAQQKTAKREPEDYAVSAQGTTIVIEIQAGGAQTYHCD